MVNRLFRRKIVYTLGFSLMLVAACSPQAAEPTNTPAPTATTFTFPTYAFVQPTEPPQVATAAAGTSSARATSSAQTIDLDPVAVERGQGRWEALECGTCHGENGEGTDDGPALAGTTLTQEEFINFLRTGGTIGNDHLYATDRLSQGGITNLYQYVLSLETE